MPRTARTRTQQKDDLLLGVISKRMTEMHINRQKLSELTGIGYGTLCNRFKKPSAFLLGELRSVADGLNVTVDTLLRNEE